MTDKPPFKQLQEKFLLVTLLASLLFSCENHGFDNDKRQIMAKDEIQAKLFKTRSFDITSFKEDTAQLTNDPDFKKVIRYTLTIEYLDSNKVLQNKKGIVLFTPDGKSIISSKITDE